ncbi:MAG: VOC family protein [Pseudomonadales bacterium]|nr:VOC family protein [Pseudomonadales bacterium]
MAKLEHVNVTVSDPSRTAEQLCRLFDWHVRWEGPSQMGGNTVHVGTDDDYVAVYTFDGNPPGEGRTGSRRGGLNHIGVVVDDLDATETRVTELGFEPFNHMDYEPGRRFYFLDHDGIEFEVISYQA